MILQRTRLSRRPMIWLLPPSPSPSAVSKMSLTQSSCVSPVELLTGVGRGREGAKSYGGEKAWSSIDVQNSIITSAFYFPACHWAFYAEAREYTLHSAQYRPCKKIKHHDALAFFWS